MLILTTSDQDRTIQVAGRKFKWNHPSEKAGAMAHAENFRQKLLSERARRLGREATAAERQAEMALDRPDDMSRADKARAEMFQVVFPPKPPAPEVHPYDQYKASEAYRRMRPDAPGPTDDELFEQSRAAYDAEQNRQPVEDDPRWDAAHASAWLIAEAVRWTPTLPTSVVAAADALLKQASTMGSDVDTTIRMSNELTARIKSLQSERENAIRLELARQRIDGIPDMGAAVELDLARQERDAAADALKAAEEKADADLQEVYRRAGFEFPGMAAE